MLKSKIPPPKINDFSRSAIRKEVRKTGLTHWLTLYPPAIGLPVGVAGILFNIPLLYGAAIGACLLSLSSVIINIFFRSDRIASRHIEKLNKMLKAHEKNIKKDLYESLENCAGVKGIGEYALHGREQFRKVQDKYENISELLEQKLSTGELTFSRFIGAAEQVYLSALDNLKQIVTLLKSAGSIDTGYINKRISQMRARSAFSDAEQKELDALNKRLELRQEQLGMVNDLLSNNEEAMTKMEETTAAIATMKTDGSFASTDFETAITQLQELAQRAQIYNKT